MEVIAMTVRNLLIVNAIYAGIVVLVAILAPRTLLELNGVEITPFTINLQRAVGAVIAGFAISSWLMRNAQTSEARRAFLIGSGLGYIVVAAVFAFNHQSVSDLVGIQSWVYVGISLLFAAAFLYLGLRQQASE
jgi:hypothetical protein